LQLRIAAAAFAGVSTLAACGGNTALAPAPAISDQAWLRAATAARHPIDVTFVAVPARGVRRVYQPDWAGPVLFAPGERPLKKPTHRFHIVEGEWIVPKARPTINCSNRHEQEDGSSLWIALDGWSATFEAHYKTKSGKWKTYPSTDILQAGSESDVPCYHGGPLRKYATSAYFWIEWAGNRNIAVVPHRHRNLVVRAGDKIYVRIDAATTGPHAWRDATLSFVDETTGYYLPPRTFHAGCIDCGTPFQRRATLFGNTAEWIVEATFYDYGHHSWPNTLDDFGSVAMTRVSTTDQDGVTYDLTDPHDARVNVDWMTWNGVPLDDGTLLACSYIDGAHQVTFARAPYAIATPGQQGQLEPKPKNCR